MPEKRKRPFGIGKHILIAIDAVDHVVAVLAPTAVLAPPFAPFTHLGVKRGEEKVLQDGFVIIAVIAVCSGIAFEQSAQIIGPE